MHKLNDFYRRFKREDLKPGESACCPYTVYDCVKSGNKEDIVDFAVSISFIIYKFISQHDNLVSYQSQWCPK